MVKDILPIEDPTELDMIHKALKGEFGNWLEEVISDVHKKVPVEEMKKDPYLEIIQFSSFVMNPMTGDFGGEIRLAYYYDGKTVTPVTGGSITCNMQDSLSSMYFSRKTRQINNCVVPQTIQVFNVNVAGEE